MLDFFGLEISTKKVIDSVFYLLIVFVVYLILRRILKLALMHAGGKKATASQKQRIKTISQMLLSILKYLMLILVMLVILADFGVNVSSLVAGLGILTAILGLAFQDMIKDFIAGVTIITEEQFGVGDIVEISGFKGTVISVGLKTTEIKNDSGQVKIIANHNIDGLINYSKFDATAMIEVRTTYETSVEKTMAALNEAKRSIAYKMKLAVKEVTITPVADDLDTAVITYRMFCPCAADACSSVQSMMREMVVDEFKKAKIAVPSQRATVTK